MPSKKGSSKKGSGSKKSSPQMTEMQRKMKALRENKTALYAKGSKEAKDAMAKARAARGTPKQISRKAAVRAFNKKYSAKNYATSRGRAAAVTRKMCNASLPVVTDARYRRSVRKYSYKGLDDGSNCPKGAKLKTSKRSVPKSRIDAALAARGLSRKQAGGSRRNSNKQQNKAVSLKTAVSLLRNYYQQRYGQ